MRAPGALPLLGLVAVQADHKATLLTHPVDVEECGLAGVTHLPHAAHCSLPRQLDCTHQTTAAVSTLGGCFYQTSTLGGCFYQTSTLGGCFCQTSTLGGCFYQTSTLCCCFYQTSTLWCCFYQTSTLWCCSSEKKSADTINVKNANIGQSLIIMYPVFLLEVMRSVGHLTALIHIKLNPK